MAMLGWVMMGLAIWHYTIFMPDRFWGGIVGAFVGSLFGAVMVGLIISTIKFSELRVPGEKETDIAVVLYAVPGRPARDRAGVPRGHAPRTRRPQAARALASRPRCLSAARRRSVPARPYARGRGRVVRLEIPDVPARRPSRACAASWASATRSRRRSCAAASASPRGHAPSWRRASEHDPRPFEGIGAAVGRSSRHIDERGGASRSTATTTSTGSARRPCW